ncbi:hypothetical protein ACHHYP_11338 [Achlya hypogyna]|uniref:BSD domain-containing protein n=1 Tax=Achlya hypogyna TaxID=1202772 RepID=A0A1V9YJF3_ACHHY|nr:hypothetical protein ACHHYP_11338 [Achlya hypogyna]
MDYGTSNGSSSLLPWVEVDEACAGFFSFASELARQITQDAMELSVTAVETAKSIAHETTQAVEKATLLAQEALSEHFPDEAEVHGDDDVAREDLITILPWVNEDGSVNEDLQDDILEISWDMANFQHLTHAELAPIFDIDRYLLVAPQLLAFDAHLRQRHFESARLIPEEVFWGNYFYQCHAARLRHGFPPYVELSSRCLQLPSPMSSTASESLADRSLSDFNLDSPESRPTSVSMPELRLVDEASTPVPSPVASLESTANSSPTELPADAATTPRRMGLPTKLKRSMSACKERLVSTKERGVHKYMEKLAHYRNHQETASDDSKTSRFQRWSQTSHDLKSSLQRHSLTSTAYIKKRASLPSVSSAVQQKLGRWVPGRGLRSKSLSVSEMQHLRDIQARLYASDAPILESPPPVESPPPSQ